MYCLVKSINRQHLIFWYESSQQRGIMPILEFEQETMPSPETFIRLLQQMDEKYDPVEELLTLERQLAGLEARHNISSTDFFERYQAGEMGDDAEFISWSGRYKLYLNLKQAISASLQLVVAERVPAAN